MLYKYCPKCGDLLTEKIIGGRSRLQCLKWKCKFIFHQNSKPTSSALILDGDKVLLGKRKIDPSKGMWDVIGGFLEPGEHPEKGMKREVREETGLKVEPTDMIGFFMDVYDGSFPTMNICYTATVTGGKLKPGDDIEELRWFEISKLPKNIAFKNGREMLKQLIRWHRNKKKSYICLLLKNKRPKNLR
ncbi:MAG: NUDIX hydrolase [Patescibacteria group bacterium]|nr:NUDIX hydrolase [Patescibacteria group bacterium]